MRELRRPVDAFIGLADQRLHVAFAAARASSMRCLFALNLIAHEQTPRERKPALAGFGVLKR